MFEGTIPVRTAALVHAAARNAGVPRAQLAAIPELDTGLFHDGLLRIPSRSVWQAWELLDAVGGPQAGQFVSAMAARGTLGVWDYLFSSAPTLAASLRTVVELWPVVANPNHGNAVIEDGRLLTVHDTAALAPENVIPAHEMFSLSLVLRRMREATEQRLDPVRVTFTQSPPRSHRHLIDEFGTARIEFDAPASTLVFIDADRLPTSGDPHVARIHRHYAQLQLASFRVHCDGNELRRAIREMLTRGESDLHAVARHLSISPRTLQRRLQEQGTSWRDELDAVRYEYATHLLRDTDLTVDCVAARLAYTDARTFRRAFARWKGMSPGVFRRTHRDTCR
ncbi:helix-turn-helix domain-containing protein [Nocardia sp. NBC_00511]|uniref:AraC family transcriptional regulator n=1 Tax=Nocardia sp. NBC_00511 TaxID=2903591 RepID=UPI0030E2AC1B